MIPTAPQSEPVVHDEILPLVGFIPVAGPPVFVAATALVLGVLMLAGPFLVIVTLLAAIALVTAGLAALASAAAAIVVLPCLLVRHVRAGASNRRLAFPGRRSQSDLALR